MADYYPLLAKAVANLPNRAAPTARRAIYERARKALIGQLRSIQPPMPESDIASEDAALDQAIARLETEYADQPTPEGRAPSSTIVSPKSTPVAPPPSPTARPAPPVARPTPAWSPKPAAASGAAPPAAAAATPSPFLKTPVAPPAPRQPPLKSPSSFTPPPPRAAPSIEPARPLSGASPLASTAPPVAAQREQTADDSSLAPPVAAAPPAALGIPPARTSPAIARPSAPGRAEAPRRSPWPLVALALLICVAGAIALTAYLWRERPQDMATKATSEAGDKTLQAGQNKIAERIKSPGQSDPAPTPTAGETPIPTVTVPVAPIQVPPSSNPAAAPTHLADSAQNAAPPQAQTASPPQAQTASPAPPAVAGGSRAAMLVGTSDPQKPSVSMGSAVWSIIPANPGQPSTLAVRVEIDVPDQKMHATVTIRKNTDASLPATHTIDLRATFADGAQIKGVKDLDLPRLRKDDSLSGDSIAGVKVKINDSYYLIGLTRSDADAAHNLDLLATRTWFDFPLVLNDDRIAKLTFAKDETGDRVMAQALDAWK